MTDTFMIASHSRLGGSRLALRNHRFRRSRGQGALLELALAFGVLSFGLLGLDNYAINFQQTAKALNVGDYLAAVGNGAENYLTANAGTLSTLVSGGPVVIYLGPSTAGGATPSEPGGLPSPISGGFLPSSFVAVDGYDQTVEMVVAQNPENTSELTALVTTVGGDSLNNSINGQIINRIGVAGGYVPLTGSTNKVLGAYGGWSMPTSSWDNVPTAGHPAVLLDFAQAALGSSDFLNRYEVNGNTTANTMETSIQMSQNSIHDANTVDTAYLTDDSGSGTVPAGTVSVGAVTTDGAITTNENLDVAGDLNNYTQVSMYNNAPIVWEPDGDTVGGTYSLQVFMDSASPYLVAGGGLGLDVTGNIIDNGNLLVVNGIYDYGTSAAIEQMDTADKPGVALTSGSGTGYVSTFGGGYVAYSSDDSGSPTVLAEINSAGIEAVNTAGTTGAAGNITSYGGNVETTTGNIGSTNGGYLFTGYRASAGTQCPAVGAIAVDASTGNEDFCTAAGDWAAP